MLSPATIQRTLLHLDLPHRPPPVTHVRGPPQDDFLLDQSPAYDPTEPEPVPRPRVARCPDFDQSGPDEFDD